MTCTTQILRTQLPILATSSLASRRAELRLMLRSVWYSDPSQNPRHWIYLFLLRLISESMLCQCTATMRTYPPLFDWGRIQSPRRLLHNPIRPNLFTTFTDMERILASSLGLGYMSFMASAHHFVPLTRTCFHPPLILSMKRMVSILSDPSLLMNKLDTSGLTVT